MTTAMHAPAGHPGFMNKEGFGLRGQKQQSQAGRAAEMSPGAGAGTHVILRGTTQAAGLAFNALPAVGPHSCGHVHREL